MEYKDTLLMPKTGFEMRGKLPTKEPGIQKKWQDEKLYEKMLAKREGCEQWILHDGPPYANGDIHIGHGLNKIIKDVIVKSKFMSGYKTPFIPGWDTHGLPIETAITKQGYDRKKMPLTEFRKLCYDYALQQVARQKAGFLSLGCIGDYDHPYITLQKEFEEKQIEVFAKMAMDGLIYKGKKPVYWSYSSESALAEAEIEYKDIKSPTIYVKFPVCDGKGILDSDVNFVIWTTTPWTIPADHAICLNANLVYAVVDTEKGKLLFLESKVDELCDEFKCEKRDIIATYKGSELEYITTYHPFYGMYPYYDRKSVIILGDHVTDEAGTGCVHTAGGHGVDDFNVACLKYGLEPYCPVDEQGFMMPESGDFLVGHHTMEDTKDENGNKVDSANKVVTVKLDELGSLLAMSWITHSYPHDWRTKKPIIFRATTQWFASIDKIRQELLDQIDAVNWIPTWGQQRMHNMIADRGDWCISRQRAWGVPIPIIYNEDGSPIMEKEVFDHIAKLVGQYGSNVWFEKDVKELLPEGYTNEKSPNGNYRKEMDTMDVWFDSGSSHTGAMQARGQGYPADLYFEGSDQYRGWFNSSLIVGTAVHGQSPYKQVLSHGFVMDEKGNKMSKSLGNTVAPKEVTGKFGADILRMWATTVDYQADCRIGNNIVKQASDSYRKVRNTFRFMLGNINPEDFKAEDLIAYDDLDEINQYILIKLDEVTKAVLDAYANYDFPEVTATLINFMTNTISAYYLDYTKDILYIEKADDNKRRQVQTVLYTCCDTLMLLWAPILVHTTEEINGYFGKYDESVHLQEFPKVQNYANAEKVVKDMDVLFAIRKDVFKVLEEKRNEKLIGKPLEAKVTLHVNDEQKAVIDALLTNVPQWFTVSQVAFTDETLPAYESVEATVTKAEGEKCPRCWNVTVTTNEDCLCDRCKKVIG